jgi:hypothetical protein
MKEILTPNIQIFFNWLIHIRNEGDTVHRLLVHTFMVAGSWFMVIIQQLNSYTVIQLNS